MCVKLRRETLTGEVTENCSVQRMVEVKRVRRITRGNTQSGKRVSENMSP